MPPAVTFRAGRGTQLERQPRGRRRRRQRRRRRREQRPSIQIRAPAVRAQRAYSAALLVHARNLALSDLGRRDPDYHAAVLSLTYNGRFIVFYAHYALGDEYHMCQLLSTPIIFTSEDYAQVLRQVHNLQDYAKHTAETLRDELFAR